MKRANRATAGNFCGSSFGILLRAATREVAKGVERAVMPPNAGETGICRIDRRKSTASVTGRKRHDIQERQIVQFAPSRRAARQAQNCETSNRASDRLASVQRECGYY
jgi:hypothetical protein